MQVTVYNSKQLDVVVRDMMTQFNIHKSLSVSYDKPFKDKSVRQLGYIFGGLVDSVRDFYLGQGVHWEKDDIKENFYQACSKIDERLCRNVQRFNGDTYQVPKRLSEMDTEEASLFIDKCLYLIDNARCFAGLVLHPSLRYTWIRHVTADELQRANEYKFPRTVPEYLEHTRQQACIWCGRMNASEAHHLKVAGYSGEAYKADDWLTVPLCHDCHIAELHQHGQEKFLEGLSWITKYIDLIDFCRVRYLRWLNKL